MTYISEDVDDLKVLSPSMFHNEIEEFGVADFEEIDAKRMNSRFAYRLRLRNDLRKRFRNEYLGQLREYYKVKGDQHVKEGDVVLIGDTNCKRLSWPLARISNFLPGRDGNVRLVQVKTSYGTFLRPIQRIYPLEPVDHLPETMDEEKNEATIERPSVKIYSTKVLTESSLSAVSDILSTKSTRRQLFKTLVFLVCVTGFFYQGGKFLTHVFKYPTIVDINIDIPKYIEMPAFTFCNNNGISRLKFCQKYKDRCTLASENFCLSYPNRCSSNETLVPKTEYYNMINSMSRNDFLEIGANLSNFLLSCKVNGLDAEGCEISGPYLRAKSETGEGRMGCYTVNLLMDGQESAVQVETQDLIKQPISEFQFDVEEDDEFIPSRQSGVVFSLHSPYLLVNPAEKGFFMAPGKTYKIYFNVKKEVLLPYPFETNCWNYTEQWLIGNKIGVRTQEMCKHKCAMEVAEKYWNCTFIYVLYPSSLPYCEDLPVQKDPEELDDEYENCANECKDDCSKSHYSITVQEVLTSDLFWEGHNEKKKNLIFVEVYLDDSEIITFLHRPQYLFVEVFSSIGGFVGVWLGISLVELTNFFEALLRILMYSLRRKNQN
ncbi:hypothetical protein JTE90_023944 [Oedothorax gibbosus]|uniref:DUF5641 domain-containing protein n=1 Tax=Oedothorax gibbosus TaxID=931172 RepID=A0AAV6TTQ7_9ARAC|nr:hypothetical protein JTE90_023944 [Oedothorax gibbosus]